MAEMQGCQALKQFVRKGGTSFSRISHTRCLSGSVMRCEKNCRKNVPCRHKNIVMVAYGKTVCGPCPSVLPIRAIGDTSDSRFEAIVEEIMHVRPTT